MTTPLAGSRARSGASDTIVGSERSSEMAIMARIGPVAMGVAMGVALVAAGCTGDDGSVASTTTAAPTSSPTSTPSSSTAVDPAPVTVDDVRDAFEASGGEYEVAELTDDPTLAFDPDELGAVEAGQVDFMIDCGVSTIEIYVFADEAAAEAAADEMEAEIEAFSCAAPDDSGAAEMASLLVGVNGTVVGVSESSSYVAAFEDLDLSPSERS